MGASCMSPMDGGRLGEWVMLGGVGAPRNLLRDLKISTRVSQMQVGIEVFSIGIGGKLCFVFVFPEGV